MRTLCLQHAYTGSAEFCDEKMCACAVVSDAKMQLGGSTTDIEIPWHAHLWPFYSVWWVYGHAGHLGGPIEH